MDIREIYVGNSNNNEVIKLQKETLRDILAYDGDPSDIAFSATIKTAIRNSGFISNIAPLNQAQLDNLKEFSYIRKDNAEWKRNYDKLYERQSELYDAYYSGKAFPPSLLDETIDPLKKALWHDFDFFANDPVTKNSMKDMIRSNALYKLSDEEKAQLIAAVDEKPKILSKNKNGEIALDETDKLRKLGDLATIYEEYKKASIINEKINRNLFIAAAENGHKYFDKEYNLVSEKPNDPQRAIGLTQIRQQTMGEIALKYVTPDEKDEAVLAYNELYKKHKGNRSAIVNEIADKIMDTVSDVKTIHKYTKQDVIQWINASSTKSPEQQLGIIYNKMTTREGQMEMGDRVLASKTLNMGSKYHAFDLLSQDEQKAIMTNGLIGSDKSKADIDFALTNEKELQRYNYGIFLNYVANKEFALNKETEGRKTRAESLFLDSRNSPTFEQGKIYDNTVAFNERNSIRQTRVLSNELPLYELAHGDRNGLCGLIDKINEKAYEFEKLSQEASDKKIIYEKLAEKYRVTAAALNLYSSDTDISKLSNAQLNGLANVATDLAFLAIRDKKSTIEISKEETNKIISELSDFYERSNANDVVLKAGDDVKLSSAIKKYVETNSDKLSLLEKDQLSEAAKFAEKNETLTQGFKYIKFANDVTVTDVSLLAKDKTGQSFLLSMFAKNGIKSESTNMLTLALNERDSNYGNVTARLDDIKALNQTEFAAVLKEYKKINPNSNLTEYDFYRIQNDELWYYNGLNKDNRKTLNDFAKIAELVNNSKTKIGVDGVVASDTKNELAEIILALNAEREKARITSLSENEMQPFELKSTYTGDHCIK